MDKPNYERNTAVNLNPEVKKKPTFRLSQLREMSDGLDRSTNFGEKIKGETTNPDIALEKKVEEMTAEIPVPATNDDIAIGAQQQSQINTDDPNAPSSPAYREDSKLFEKAGSLLANSLTEIPRLNAINRGTPESSQEARGRFWGNVSSFAKMGSAFGVVGTGVGAALGAIVGGTGNSGWREKKLEKERDDYRTARDLQTAERKRMYLKERTSEQIQKEIDLFKQSEGYIT